MISEIKRYKEILDIMKMQELFGINYQFMEWFDYDKGCLNNGVSVSKADKIIYNNFRNILKNDTRFNKGCELVAVVSLTICNCSDIPDFGKIIRSPRYAKPSVKFLRQTHYAGTIICRDKKSGKILPVPNKWLYTGFSTCVTPRKHISLGLPGVANLIDRDICCLDYDNYEKLIRIHLFERQK